MEFIRIADKKRVAFITTSISKTIPAGSSVLDMGCGNGYITKAIAELGFHVTGIDLSEKTIKEAQQLNAHPNVIYKVAGANELRAEPLAYHAIICSEVLEHLEDPGALLDILRQSLKIEGVLIVTVPNGRGPRELFVTRPVQYIQKKNNFLSRSLRAIKNAMGYRGVTEQSSADDLTHIQFFTVGSLNQLASTHGFRIEQIKKTNFIEQVFPFSLLTKRIKFLQQLDCRVAEALPLSFTSGFMSVWKKI